MQDTNEPTPSDIRDDTFLDGLTASEDGKLVGPVKLTARLSKGGMGVVYRGRHLKLDIDVAVKFLLPHLAADNPEYVVRFEREARMAAKLNNENLVRVFDVDSEKEYHYVVMELVCGETARDRVARKGPLAEDEALEILCGATRGLEAAHASGIVHRDIKPDNVMIDASGLVKLADLGIAKAVRDTAAAETDLTQAGLVMGTPSFMPPEQLRDARSVGFPGDVYSMGATLYFLLTGKPPFAGSLYEIFEKITRNLFPDVRDDRPGLSDAAIHILERCTRSDPAERYRDATALLEALEATGAGARRVGDPLTGTVTAVAKVSTPPARRLGEVRLEVTTDAPAPTARARDRERRRPLWKPAVAVLLVAAALAGTYLVASRSGDPVAPRDLAEAGPAPAPQGSPAQAAPPPAEPAGKPDQQPAEQPVEEPVEEPAVAATMPEPEPEPPTRPVTEPEPEPPAETDALEDERRQLEEGLARARELAAGGDATAGMEVLVQLRPAVARLPELSASYEELQEELTLRKNQVRLMARTRQLIELQDTRGALNILSSQLDWGPFEADVFALKLRALLRARPTRADEALALYEKRRSATPSISTGDPVLRGGYRELLEHAAAVPATQSSAAVWSVSLAYWRALPPLPEQDAELRRLRGEVAARLGSAYLTGLVETAKKAAASHDARGARQALEDALGFAEAEGIEDAVASELEELRGLVEGSETPSEPID